MKKVIIVGENDRDIERRVKLTNGNLVIHRDNGEIKGVYIVTSFRFNNNRPQSHEKDFQTSTYCTLVNLENGKIQFEERCSRATTEKRVLSHLNPNIYNTEKETFGNQTIEVLDNDMYQLQIKKF